MASGFSFDHTNISTDEEHGNLSQLIDFSNDPESVNHSFHVNKFNYSFHINNFSTVDRIPIYIFQDVLVQFKHTWNHLLSVFIPLEFAVMVIGLCGNILALTTLVFSSKMRTPSFVYHRALVGADLLFCINFFLNYITDRWLTVNSSACENAEETQYVFRYWLAAVYSGILYTAVNNTCGFLIIYTTLIIAFERTLALLCFRRYRDWNHHRVALSAVAVATALSLGLNSWSTFLERSVVSYTLEYPSIQSPCWNESIVYQWELRKNVSEVRKEALKVRHGYNSAIRIVYPFLLSLLTIGVFYGLAKRHKRRRRNRSRVSNAFLSVHNHHNDHRSASVSAISLLGQNIPPLLSRTRSKEKGNEKMLLLLMIAVVALAFLHVTAGEAKRILLILFPPDVILRDKVANPSLGMDERLSYFKLILYGQQISRLVANFCTAVDRSFICILHMAMNKLFRQEVLALFRKLFSPCVGNDKEMITMQRRQSGLQMNEMDESNAIVINRPNSLTLSSFGVSNSAVNSSQS